jgi:hypothetical protein
MLFSIFMCVTTIFDTANIGWAHIVINALTGTKPFLTNLVHIVPAITAFGCWFVIMWGDPKGENASRGAMDNATGIALSYEVIRYFKENPDKIGLPDCCVNLPSEQGKQLKWEIIDA